VQGSRWVKSKAASLFLPFNKSLQRLKIGGFFFPFLYYWIIGLDAITVASTALVKSFENNDKTTI